MCEITTGTTGRQNAKPLNKVKKTKREVYIFFSRPLYLDHVQYTENLLYTLYILLYTFVKNLVLWTPTAWIEVAGILHYSSDSYLESGRDSTSLRIFDVPSRVTFWRSSILMESCIECTYLLWFFVTAPRAPITTGTTLPLSFQRR